jgi:hypothetical protein
VVSRNGKPIAILAPYPDSRSESRSLRDVLSAWIAAGERDEELAELLEQVRRSDAPAEDPWESP